MTLVEYCFDRIQKTWLHIPSYQLNNQYTYIEIWLELESAGSAWIRSARSSFCKTDSHSFCNKTTFLRVIPTMAHINTYYININFHEYLKIPETYSDILYDILSDILSGTLSGILSGILPGTLSGIGFLLTFFLASSIAHCDCDLAVGVRQGPRRSRAGDAGG